MRMTTSVRLLGIGVLLIGGGAWLRLHSTAQVPEPKNSGVIAGIVTSATGPEAGVWVIAETDNLKTKFRKIVVTDGEGRFLLPELPKANYRVWVRGYGLVDSEPVTGRPDLESLRLTARLARTPQQAAKVYPSNYWASLLEVPKAIEFPGSGIGGNGINPEIETQAQWVNNIKACQRCHQVGNEITREIPDLERFESAVDAWDHRVRRGQRGSEMTSFVSHFGRERGLRMLAEWSTRIAAGQVPPAPPRPAGAERNVVITIWNWGDSTTFVHDEIATDKRNPRVNPYGFVYGVDVGNDFLMIADPVNHTWTRLKIPMRVDPSTVPTLFSKQVLEPYRYFDKAVWINPVNPHNPMMDAAGRVWLTAAIRGRKNPDWCHEGSDNEYAKYFPLGYSGRQAGYYDPKTQQFTLIDTCVGTHHLQFAEDENDRLYFSGSGQAVGWTNTRLYDRTGNERISHGWCPIVIDTNGDGRITKPWNEPGENVDATHDTRINTAAYGIIVNPVDDAIWGAEDRFPGLIFRLDPGENPPETCVSEVYRLPVEQGYYRPRGIDVDRNGVIWTALAGSSHFASFDRRKCDVLNGPTALGRHCDAGWTFYRVPGVSYANTDVGTDFHYYNWVDQFDTLGLGANIPIATGSSSDSLLALKPDTREWIVLRVPYPLGFHPRGVDGRIDDPDAGWKGRGLYANYGADAVWHIEGGPEEATNLVKFQLRPDPLAK